MKKIQKSILCGVTILSLSFTASVAQAAILDPYHLIANFDFNGSFTMFDPDGNMVGSPGGVRGAMSLDFLTFGGVMKMEGDPFAGAPWTVDGDMSAHVDLLGGLTGKGVKCAGKLMCADARMNFVWGVNEIPVDASFSMAPNINLTSINLTELLKIVSFDVKSIDTDGDNILGTVMDQGPFPGFTPFFEGVATISAIHLGNKLPNPGYNFDRPDVTPIPIPAAVWLFGSGLLGLVGLGRRKTA